MAKNRTLVAHTAGPGDVIGTYRRWLAAEADPREVSETYSGPVYRIVRELAMSAYVISSHHHREVVNEDWITIEHRPGTSEGKRGLAFHIAELGYLLGVIRTFIGCRADVALIGDTTHWWTLALLRLAGVKVIPVLHCTLWPRGYKPKGLSQRIIRSLNGWFWRYIPEATICISPECERQARELGGPRTKGHFIQARPHYYPGYFDTLAAPDWNQRPFRMLYAGRMERNKGIFDLLDVATLLRNRDPHGYKIKVCGSGSSAVEFSDEIIRRQLTDIIEYPGQLDRDGMRSAYEQAHLIIVPTTSAFIEGLNRVVVEGVLAGRPVVATDVCPAVDLLKWSVVSVRPGDIKGMFDAIIRLSDNFEAYESMRKNCSKYALPFYTFDESFSAALLKALQKTSD